MGAELEQHTVFSMKHCGFNDDLTKAIGDVVNGTELEKTHVFVNEELRLQC